MLLGFWLVRFCLTLAVWKWQRDRLAPGSRGVSCSQAGGGSLLGDFGAPSITEKSARAHVEGPLWFSACPSFRISCAADNRTCRLLAVPALLF